MTTPEFFSTDAICEQVRTVLVNGPKTRVDEVLFDFLRGYMKASSRDLSEQKGKPVTATLTHCRHGKALAVLESEPFNGMEATPA